MTHISRHGGKAVALFNIFLFAILELFATFGLTAYQTAQHHSVELATRTTFNHYETKTPITPIENPNLSSTYKPNVIIANTTSSYTTQSFAQNSIRLGNNTIPITTSSDTGWTPNNAAARFFGKLPNQNGKFIYAHNRAHLFAPLTHLSIGNTFTINLDGTTRQYVIVYKITLPKSSITNAQMNVIARAEWNGVSYDLSLMTCAGAGDANRIIVFANIL